MGENSIGISPQAVTLNGLTINLNATLENQNQTLQLAINAEAITKLTQAMNEIE